MEIRFCDICNESVPQSDLEASTAIIRKGRVICANCEASMSFADLAEGDPAGASGAAEGPGGAAAVAAAPGMATVRPPIGPPHGLPANESHVAVAARRESGRGLGGVLMAGLMGTVALIVTSIVTVILVERLELVAGDARADRTRLEREIVAEVSRLEAILERWREEDRALMREELLEARADAGRSRARMDERITTVREEMVGLRDIVARLDAIEADVGTRGDRVREIGTDLAQVKRDVGVLAERWMEALAIGDVAPSGETVTADREPEWMEHTRGLESPNAASRWTAVTALGEVGDPGSVPYLVGMLSDPDIFVRMATARVLGDIGSDEAVPVLIDALEDDELPVREAAVFALRTITGQNLRYEPDAVEADRARRIRAWRDWWKKNNKT